MDKILNEMKLFELRILREKVDLIIKEREEELREIEASIQRVDAQVRR